VSAKAPIFSQLFAVKVCPLWSQIKAAEKPFRFIT
jgi:hypothetical protein